LRRFLALIMVGVVAMGLITPATAQANFGIDPGKVYIDNLHPGAKADFLINVYNQSEQEVAFEVKARGPDYTEVGYDALSYLGWITITPDRLTIAANKQSEVRVVVTMPADADYSGKKSEVWISFMEQETQGMVKIELCSRVMISTRVEAAKETPAIHSDGAVGLTVEAEDKNGDTEVEGEVAGVHPFLPWPVIGSIIGVLVVGGVFLFLMRIRKRV